MFKTKNGMAANAIKKFDGQEGLIQQNKVKGELAMTVYTLGFLDNEGNISRTS